MSAKQKLHFLCEQFQSHKPDCVYDFVLFVGSTFKEFYFKIFSRFIRLEKEREEC